MQLGPLPPIPDDQLLKSFERHLRAERKEKRTLDHYLFVVKNFAAFCLNDGIDSVTKAKTDTAELWLESLHSRLKPYSVNSYYRALRVFFRWLVAEEEIKRSPLERIKEPSVEEVAKDIVSPPDMAKTLAMLEKQRRWRDCALIAVLYDTGLRASEVAGIRVENVNLDTGIIVIPHTKANRIKTVHISPATIRYIDRYHRKPRLEPDYLINGRKGHLTRTGVLRAVKSAFKEAGVEGVIGAHDLRHTSASHQVEFLQESEAMALFGWKSPAMYRHYAQRAINEAALKAHERSSPMSRLPKKS